jgi:hypothetical protein
MAARLRKFLELLRATVFLVAVVEPVGEGVACGDGGEGVVGFGGGPWCGAVVVGSLSDASFGGVAKGGYQFLDGFVGFCALPGEWFGPDSACSDGEAYVGGVAACTIVTVSIEAFNSAECLVAG